MYTHFFFCGRWSIPLSAYSLLSDWCSVRNEEYICFEEGCQIKLSGTTLWWSRIARSSVTQAERGGKESERVERRDTYMTFHFRGEASDWRHSSRPRRWKTFDAAAFYNEYERAHVWELKGDGSQIATDIGNNLGRGEELGLEGCVKRWRSNGQNEHCKIPRQSIKHTYRNTPR